MQWTHPEPSSVMTSWAVASYVRAKVSQWPSWLSVGIFALACMQLLAWCGKSPMRRYCRETAPLDDMDDFAGVQVELQPVSLLTDCPISVILLEVSCVLGLLLLLLSAAAWRTSVMVPTAVVSPSPVAVLTAAAPMGFTLGSMLLLLAILWMILPWHVMLALSTCLTGFLLTTTGLIIGRTVQDDDPCALSYCGRCTFMPGLCPAWPLCRWLPARPPRHVPGLHLVANCLWRIPAARLETAALIFLFQGTPSLEYSLPD